MTLESVPWLGLATTSQFELQPDGPALEVSPGFVEGGPAHTDPVPRSKIKPAIVIADTAARIVTKDRLRRLVWILRVDFMVVCSFLV